MSVPRQMESLFDSPTCPEYKTSSKRVDADGRDCDKWGDVEQVGLHTATVRRRVEA